MKRNFLILALLFAMLIMPLLALAQEGGTPAGDSPFWTQCPTINSAVFSDWTIDDSELTQRWPLDLDRLTTMQYTPGIYSEDPVPNFGRHFVMEGEFAKVVGTFRLDTPCGSPYIGRGYLTQEGDVLLILETLPRGEIEKYDICVKATCGRHKIAIFYITLEEWQRVTQYRAE